MSIKNEITEALNQLSSGAHMGLVAYNSGTYVWSPTAKRANNSAKGAALGWMNMLVPIESHNILDAVLSTMQIAQSAPGGPRQKRIIVMGSRKPPNIQQCLESITAANYQDTPINTVYFTSNSYSGEEDFYVQLAAMNAGLFQQVDY
jgi:hypothetical protein